MAAPRRPLDRDLVVGAAVDLADAEGLSAVTMNGLGARLGVRGMSLYHHVAGKDAILDGMVDRVFDEVERPDGEGWSAAMRHRSISFREALLRHPWAVGLLDSRRNPGPGALAHHEWMLRCLRVGGFDVGGAVRAFTILDAYVYGFVLQEVSIPMDADGDVGDVGDVVDEITAGMSADAHPHLIEAAAYASDPGFSFGAAFEPGLDLVLSGLRPSPAAAQEASTAMPSSST
jgi:AcrR family transcriptional regulator